MRFSPNPGFWNPRTLPVSLPSGRGEGGTSFLGRGFFSDDLRGDSAIGLDDMELPDMIELVVPYELSIEPKEPSKMLTDDTLPRSTLSLTADE